MSTLTDNLTEGLHKCKCKVCKSSLEYVTATLTFKCMKCDKSDYTKFNEDLIKRFGNTYRFCNGGINEFYLMLGRGVCYPCIYMNT